MAAIDIPLDDFIKMKKIRGSSRGGGNPNRRRGGHPGGGGGGFRNGGGRNAGGGGRNSGGYSSNRPRNNYVDLDDPQVFTVPSGVSFNKTVRINISNLAPTVISEDLEELFQSYSIESATVHYNESGVSLGTGDIFLKKRDAERLVKEFAGVALDNQVMKFLLVDAAESLVSRVDFSGRVGGGIQKRTSQPYSRGGGGGDRRGPRSGGFRGNRPQGGGGGRQNGTGRRREERPKKTQEELDAELDAYMAKKSG